LTNIAVSCSLAEQFASLPPSLLIRTGAELRAVLRCEKHSFSFCHPRAFRDEELFRKLKGRQKGGPGDCQKRIL